MAWSCRISSSFSTLSTKDSFHHSGYGTLDNRWVAGSGTRHLSWMRLSYLAIALPETILGKERGLLRSYGEVKLETQECTLNIEMIVCASMKWNIGLLRFERPAVGIPRKKRGSLERNPLGENSVIAECQIVSSIHDEIRNYYVTAAGYEGYNILRTECTGTVLKIRK